ncbi:UNVERIFIED_CONTAM: RNA polymerase sigma-70 factor (ECF subfamily) [Brevibacillus sp. OAP136]
MDRQESIKRLFELYCDDVFRYLVYYTGSRDVEDMVQEVFIKALKAYETFAGRSHPKTWLLTIARNTAIDFARKNRRWSFLPESWLTNVQANEQTPDEIVTQGEEKEQLYAALSRLKPNYREVLILRGIKELSAAQTAEILDCSENKVNVTMHRAMKALRAQMGDYADERELIKHVR